MIIKCNRIKLIKLFAIITFFAIICLFSSKNVQAQFFPQFPAYPYFSPFVSFPTAPFPSLAPSFAPFAPFAPPTRWPTASIQGTTVFIPTTLTAFDLKIPGFGNVLTAIGAPITVFIYPSGYVPPAPILPLPFIPTVVNPSIIPPPGITPILPPPPVLAPTFISVPPPTAIAPIVVPTPIVAPTVVAPATTGILPSVSGLLFPFSFPSFPSYNTPYFPINPIFWW